MPFGFRVAQNTGYALPSRYLRDRRPGFARRKCASREAVVAGYPNRRSRANDEFEVGQLRATSLVVLSSTVGFVGGAQLIAGTRCVRVGARDAEVASTSCISQSPNASEAAVSQVRVHNFSISLDGFGTGEGITFDAPFGHAGHRPPSKPIISE